MSAAARAGRVRLDRLWRDVRVHTLHDPVGVYMDMGLGSFVLLRETPLPSWSTWAATVSMVS